MAEADRLAAFRLVLHLSPAGDVSTLRCPLDADT